MYFRMNTCNSHLKQWVVTYGYVVFFLVTVIVSAMFETSHFGARTCSPLDTNFFSNRKTWNKNTDCGSNDFFINISSNHVIKSVYIIYKIYIREIKISFINISLLSISLTVTALSMCVFIR